MPVTLLLLVLQALSPLEGERVGSVTIEGVADAPVRFGRYLEVRAGEPLQASVVRHVVEVLHATGEFEDVVVRAEPGPEGLDVVFHLVPAPFLAEVRVEGDAVVTPAALRRIARLRAQEPLWASRLDKAAQDVALRLARDGYLEASVTAALERAPAGAIAVFTIRSGARVRVGETRLEGVSAAEAARLAALAALRRGDVYRRSEALAAADKIRKRLVASGRWRARVALHESYDPGSARVALVYAIEPGSRTSVAFRGDRISAGLRGRLETLLREGALKGDALEEATDKIEEEQKGAGHRDVTVARSIESAGDHETVAYDVHGGAIATVASVKVLGAPGLEALVTTREGAALDDRRIDADARALARALEEDGHVQAKVDVELREGGGLIPVTFRARPTLRTVIASVSVEAPSPAGAEAPRELREREGRPYRARDLALDRNDLLSSYRDAGYLQAEVTPEVALSADRSEARVTLRVAPGPRTDVDHIILAGLDRTREEVVRRELLVREGEPLGLQRVLDSQRRLGGLGIFRRVTISEMDPESFGRRSLLVTAEEAARTTVSYGVGYAERDLLRGSAEVTRRNLSGMDRSVSLFIRASFRGSRFLATYREPYIFGRRQELFVTGFREEEQRDTFSFTRVGGLLQTARALSPRWSLILRDTFQQTSVFDLQVPLDEVDRQYRSSTFSGPSVSLVNDTRDDPLDPRRGRFVGADVSLSTRLLGGDSFLKAFLQGATYSRLRVGSTLALNARIGLGRTLGVGEPLRLPLPDRFFAGGDYSLRGFKLDTVGPLELGTSGRLVPTGGNALLAAAAELRQDVGRFLSVAAFGEAGNVYALVEDIDLGDVRYVAGLGLRYRSALGPIRIDWGYKLNRRANETPYHFHFTIGHAF
jgi:outer membrane protein insertion porin family